MLHIQHTHSLRLLQVCASGIWTSRAAGPPPRGGLHRISARQLAWRTASLRQRHLRCLTARCIAGWWDEQTGLSLSWHAALPAGAEQQPIMPCTLAHCSDSWGQCSSQLGFVEYVTLQQEGAHLESRPALFVGKVVLCPLVLELRGKPMRACRGAGRAAAKPLLLWNSNASPSYWVLRQPDRPTDKALHWH